MSDETKEKVLEKLEAAVTASDADFEDLGIVNKTEYEETQDEIESLREENSDLEEENDFLQEEIDEIKKMYAESLGEATGLEADFFMDKGLEELKELHEEKTDEDESLVDTPSPKSGDTTTEENEGGVDEEKREEVLSRVNENFENPALRQYPRTSEVEGEDDLRQIIETYESRGGIWESAAEPYRDALDELTAD